MVKRTLFANLMAAFLLMITVLTGVAFQILVNAQTTMESYQSGLSSLVSVADLTQAVDHGATELGQLVTYPDHHRVVEAFSPVGDEIHRRSQQLPPTTVNPASDRKVQDLARMADSFLVEADAATYALQAGDLDLYFQHDRKAVAIAGYVRNAAEQLLASELDTYRRVYPEAAARDRHLQVLNLTCLVILTLEVLLFAWCFARRVTNPIQALGRAARRIAAGDLSGPPVEADSGDELAVLGRGFNHMQESLRRQVAELEEKADLERRLQAEELERLRIHSLLGEVELRALQSQVNPHFLFNTLNMVAKMALLEEAGRTRTMLEVVADLLRYSLRDLDRPVALGEEVEQVRRYTTIQGQRFRDRIRFMIDCDDAAATVPVPCLTLQPLVENALIHGIGSREEGGLIRITVRREPRGARVVIADNGVGIPPERLQHLMEGVSGAESTRYGHTTGLGIRNVWRRMELFYGPEARLTLESPPGEGTVVTLYLPESPSEEVLSGAHPGGG